MTTSAPSVAPPPPRPPPASFEVTPAQSMMSTVPFLGSAFQTAPFMGAMTHGYGNVYDPYNRMGAFGGNFFGYNFLDNNFIRQAEESSRNAFQSIESIVGALTSVANMLNSTHTAVFSSFRAIVGVIQQIHMMRQQTYYTLLTLMHFLRMLLRRVLCWLRLRPKNYANAESVWASLTIQSQDGSASVAPSPTFNWATLFFWIVALGGPYLVYRCVSKMIRDAEDSRRWATGKMEHYTAQALYDFDASNSQELSFRAFDMLRVAPKLLQPKIRDWLLASSVDGERIGLVPINYIKLINRNLTNTPPHSTTNLAEASNSSSKQTTAMASNKYPSAFDKYESAFQMAYKRA